VKGMLIDKGGTRHTGCLNTLSRPRLPRQATRFIFLADDIISKQCDPKIYLTRHGTQPDGEAGDFPIFKSSDYLSSKNKVFITVINNHFPMMLLGRYRYIKLMKESIDRAL
jgi:hypothetical protein